MSAKAGQADAPKGRGRFFTGDTPCSQCGYNLKGLHDNVRCPECGTPVRRVRARYQFTDAFVTAPESYLRLMSLGSMAMFAGFIGILLGGGLFAATDHVLPAMVFGAASVAWWGGVMVLTRPRPVQQNSEVDPLSEWGFVRMGARITQAAWVPAAGAAIVIGSAGQSGAAVPGVLYAVQGACALFAMIGVAFVSLQLSNILIWAAEDTYSLSLRTMSVVMPLVLIATYLYAVVHSRVMPGLLATVFMIPVGVVFSFLYTVVILVPLGWFAFCLYSFQSIATWSVSNQLRIEERDEKLRERAAAMAATADHSVPDPDPGSITGSTLAPTSDVPPPAKARIRPMSREYVRPKFLEQQPPFELAPEDPPQGP